MGYQTEQQLEENLVKDLAANGYERITIKDEEDLIANFRIQLERHNFDKLMEHEITGFTDNEFSKILNHLNGGSIFEKAKKLRGEWELPLDNGRTFYLSFMNMDKWCQNLFQVTNQVTMVGRYENRYDVTILINGLPLVQIELKRKGKELKEAFNQIIRYHQHSYKNLFNYIQLFVLSNGVDTKYFSNNRTLNYSQTFNWTDENNKKYNRLHEFTSTFLEKCHLSKMIAKYIVLHQGDSSLMVLRPYQYFAVEKIIESVENNAMKNGYIWHTTGSGKTLTSFKASQIIARLANVDKVIFCVDRKDLDYQTMKEFNSFEPGSIDSTENSKQLVRQLKNNKDKIIITTLQKLNNVVNKQHYKKELEDVINKRIVFIFDECHRSQFGDSHKAIDKFFTNKQFFGFTGTPIFVENSLNNRTTEDLFGKRLHSYIIKDAIADGNVLGFSVEYFNTFTDSKFKCKESDRDIPYDEIEGSIDKKELFDAPERLEKIVDHILSIHKDKTKAKIENGGFTAMFAVSSVQTLIKYYDIFKSKDHDLNIATIFSYNPNSDFAKNDGTFDVEGQPESEVHARVKLDEYVNDYNKMFGENFDINKDGGFNAYYVDISKKVREKKIDILLVVNMFLTGFDSKTLNTIYTDKNLKFHGLIQAYSRTNRILNNVKNYGNIVNYRNIYKATNEAIALFSDEDAIATVLMKTYAEYLTDTIGAIKELTSKFATLEIIDDLQSESEKAEFVRLFRNVMRGLNMLDTFMDFTYSDLPLTEEEINEYKSKYLEIYDRRKDPDKVSILEDIDFEIELLRQDHINVDYIINLIATIEKGTEKAERQIQFILKEIESNPALRSKRDLIEQFIEESNFGMDPSIDVIGEALVEFMEIKKAEEIERTIAEHNLNADIFKNVISEYEYSNKENKLKNELKKCFIDKLQFKERTSKSNLLKDAVINIVERYQMGY